MEETLKQGLSVYLTEHLDSRSNVNAEGIDLLSFPSAEGVAFDEAITT